MRKTKDDLQLELDDLKLRFDNVFAFYKSAREDEKYWMNKYFTYTDVAFGAVSALVFTNFLWLLFVFIL